MDDRPFNSRIKIRTSGGSQIILDDTNERMYLSTGEGESYLELDNKGNIDMYSGNRLSVHAEKDLNFSAGESIRFKSGGFISMYAGNQTGQSPLSAPLAVGEIRIHSSNDLNLKVDGKMQSNIDGDFLSTIDGTSNITFGSDINIGVDGSFGLSTLSDINLSGNDVTFTISGKGTTIDTLTSFLDGFVDTYNNHGHVGAGVNLNLETPIELPSPVAITVIDDDTQLAPWTNRVPQHEPWPRVLMQDSDDTVNSENDGYVNNIDWVEQYDNVGESGRKNIGKVEGDVTISRGKFWRR
jgi:hypothetical protein